MKGSFYGKFLLNSDHKKGENQAIRLSGVLQGRNEVVVQLYKRADHPDRLFVHSFDERRKYGVGKAIQNESKNSLSKL